MLRGGFRHLALISLVTVLTAAPAAYSEASEVVDIKTRQGVTVPVSIDMPPGATAAVVLFPGGSAAVSLASGNDRHFLSHNRRRFVDAGFATIVVGPPSDNSGHNDGMSGRFRLSKEHMQDIAAVVVWTKRKTGLPVWLVGNSFGTYSAGVFASKRSQMIDGVVLMSSITDAGRGLKSILDYPIDRISVPLLAVAHEDDVCEYTPPEGAQRLVEAATRSPDARAVIVSGGFADGDDPCVPGSHHTFNDVEGKAVTAVADFIKVNAPVARPGASRSGGRSGKLSPDEVRAAVVGKTLRFRAPQSGKELLVYFAEDGTAEQKLVGGGRILKKRWSIRSNGTLCRTLTPQREHCAQVRSGTEEGKLELSNSKAGFRYTAQVQEGRQLR